MTEQQTLGTNGARPGAVMRIADAIGERLEPILDRLAEALVERRVFEHTQDGSRTVITASALSTWGGYAFGFGGDKAENGGGGGGIGGGGEGRPVAVIEVTDDGVRVRPVIDFTKIGITVVAAVITIWKALR